MNREFEMYLVLFFSINPVSGGLVWASVGGDKGLWSLCGIL